MSEPRVPRDELQRVHDHYVAVVVKAWIAVSRAAEQQA
jgi:hypothetical protein